MPARTLEIHGRKIFLNESGDPRGRPVLFLHGSGPGASGAANWQPLLNAYANEFNGLAPDLIGFGESDHPDPPPTNISDWLELWVEQVIGLLDALRIERVPVVGNSMGSALALHLMDRHPERFERAVLLAPAGTPHRVQPALERMWSFYDEPTLERMLEIVGWFHAGPKRWIGGPAATARARLRSALEGARGRSLQAMFSAPRQSIIDAIALPAERLAQIGQRCLVLHGREDNIVPFEASYFLLKHLPNVEAHFFSACSHWIILEHPEALKRMVREFLV